MCEIMERYMEDSMNLPMDQIAKAVSMEEEEIREYLSQV